MWCALLKGFMQCMAKASGIPVPPPPPQLRPSGSQIPGFYMFTFDPCRGRGGGEIYKLLFITSIHGNFCSKLSVILENSILFFSTQSSLHFSLGIKTCFPVISSDSQIFSVVDIIKLLKFLVF